MKILTVISYLLGAMLGFTCGALLVFLSTPLLWKLEGILHVELAGHSGPADWICIAGGLLGAAAMVLFIAKRGNKQK